MMNNMTNEKLADCLITLKRINRLRSDEHVTLEEAAKRLRACKKLTHHDKTIIDDLEILVKDKNSDFWPRALAIGALRLIRNAYNYERS